MEGMSGDTYPVVDDVVVGERDDGVSFVGVDARVGGGLTGGNGSWLAGWTADDLFDGDGGVAGGFWGGEILGGTVWWVGFDRALESAVLPGVVGSHHGWLMRGVVMEGKMVQE